MTRRPDRGRLRRIGVAALTVLSAVAVFAVLGGIGLANGVIGVAQYQPGGGKVTICHKGHTITISKKAWPAHQRHGDSPGTCAAAKRKDKGKHKGNGKHTTTTTTATTTTTTTETDHGKGHEKSGGDTGAQSHGNGNSDGNGKGRGHDK